MNILTALPLAVLRVQYTIVRYPLHVIDDRVISHLAPSAPARRLYRGGLGLLDGAVGTVLGHQDRAHRAANAPAPPRVAPAPGSASVKDDDARAVEVTDAEVEATSRSATVEHAELNEKAAQQLDTDLLAERLKVQAPHQLEHSPSIDTVDPSTATVVTQLTDAASTEPGTTLTGELADRVAEIARAETPPPGTGTTPTGKHH
ncbi:hypothetical protein ACFVKB_16915 [Rhodococcus sp. NPDC127530]|uniref:hypothetical protein n=1 Tax=unclassified Rhodococcus (in: high G+C Gram-positive bacteria) TaxID=192944 RepID=UPI00362FC9D7